MPGEAHGYWLAGHITGIAVLVLLSGSMFIFLKYERQTTLSFPRRRESIGLQQIKRQMDSRQRGNDKRLDYRN
jgi:hypothetical protein